jgi:hypothetical protein
MAASELTHGAARRVGRKQRIGSTCDLSTVSQVSNKVAVTIYTSNQFMNVVVNVFDADRRLCIGQLGNRSISEMRKAAV